MGRWFHRYINGTKGVISILLALLMTPMLSVALILVEAARYQSAVETLEELLDSAGLSTLANYDSYLEDRFGLLAVSQDGDLSDTFSGYLEKNIALEGDGVTLDEISAEGAYSLGSTGVLKQQLLEYSEIIVPAQMAYDGLDVQNKINDLRGKFSGKLEKISKNAQLTTDCASLASDFGSAIEKMSSAQEKYEAVGTAKTAYRTAYEELQTKLTALASAITDARQNASEAGEEEDGTSEEEENETPEETDLFETPAVKEALEAAEEAKEAYADAAGSFASKLSSFKTDATSVVTKLSKLCESFSKIKADFADEKELYTAYWLFGIMDEISNVFGKFAAGQFGTLVTEDIQTLTNQKAALERLDLKSAFDTEDAAAVAESLLTEENEYCILEIDSYEYYTELSLAVAQATASDEESTGILDALTTALDLLDNVVNLEFLYNLSLNAEVPEDSLYTSTSPAAYATVMQKAGELISALWDARDATEEELSDEENQSLFRKVIDGIVSVLKTFFSLLVGLIKIMATLLTAIGAFLAAIVAFAWDLLTGLTSLATSGLSEMYNSLLLTGYVTYTLPNRTNYSGGKTLTGYSYSKVFQDLAGGSSSNQISGTIQNFSDTGNLSVSHPLFYGAELEYVAAGTNNEITNQISVVAAIFLMRIICDFDPVTSDEWILMEEALGNACSGGILGTVYKYVMILVEAFFDTLILVNGGKEYLFKDNIYMSPTGYDILLEDIISCSGLSYSSKSTLKDCVKEKQQKEEEYYGVKSEKGDTKRQGTLEMDYRETVMFICLLTVKQETMLKRIQNIVQMEAAYNYRAQFNFDLDEACTYIRTDVTGFLNPLFPLDGLGSDGPFAFQRTQYTGY